MNKLSIVQIMSSPVWGGREHHVKDLTKGLTNNGHDVIVITRNYPDIIKKYKEIAEVVTLPLKNAVDFHSVRALIALIKKHKVDVIHTHCGRDTWIALMATKIAGRGKVFTTRHTVFKGKSDLVHRWCYKNMEKIICVSHLLRNEFLKTCSVIKPEKVVVVYNGVDTKNLLEGDGQDIRHKLNAQDLCLIGYAGRISGEKGVEYLIEAGRYLKDKHCKFKIVIAGEGPNEDYLLSLREKISQYELHDEVVFLGFADNIANFMNAIDILVLPSVCQEAFGLVLCEAMVCNKVVITSNAGAQEELITSGQDGFLVSPRSAEEIADIIANLIKDPNYSQEVGKKAKEKVLSCFTLKHMADSMEKCYRGEDINDKA